MTTIPPSLQKSLHDFLRPFNRELSKPESKALLKLSKGMIESKTVQITQIGRAIAPELKPKDFCESMGLKLAQFEQLSSIQFNKRQTFDYLIVDESDMQRPYAKKIEGVVSNYDGSSKDSSGQGYNLMGLIGKKGDQLTPLALARYQEKNLFRKDIIQEYIDAHGPDHGAVWMADRGWDDIKIFEFLLEGGQQFLIRLDAKGSQRHLSINNEESYPITLLCSAMGDVGYRRVFLKGSNILLTLIKYHHGKKEPLYLLTTRSPKSLAEAEIIARTYLERWDIETYLRFVKQKFQLESTMLQKIDRIDGLLALVLLVSAFVMKHTPSTHDRSLLALLYFKWLEHEQAEISHDSFARFLADIFASWTLTFRITSLPRDSLQQNLFP